MKLSHPTPRMTVTMAKRVAAVLEGDCGGYQCVGGDATLTRRILRNQTVQVHLQCNGCGRSLAGALARDEHYEWQSYQPWDNQHDARRDAEFAARQEQFTQQRAALEAEREDRRDALLRRRAEYEEWCRTSPEWGRLRGLVARRAGMTCEACLTGPVQQVHHLTYQFGKMPPAWHLRGVCLPCHRRLHANFRGGEDEWCQADWC